MKLIFGTTNKRKVEDLQNIINEMNLDIQVIGMEDMCAIFVHIYSLNIFAIDIASQVRAFVDDQTGLACLVRHMRKGSTEQSRTYYEVVVMCLHIVDYLLCKLFVSLSTIIALSPLTSNL